jgi:hypothetical protein
MVGDTLEGRAVDNVFGELGGVLIGSVGNIDMDDVFPSLRLTIGL